ncbi:MAG: hypothetical protein J6Y20_10425 [Lachnospiraceae bacterium]|nr:hypothetical protein [Lachnospiraceae bacterium]
MIAINKAEAEAIRERFPDTHIVRTMKQKSKRHRYYCEENKRVMRFLDASRNGYQPSNRKEGGYHTDRKKDRRIGA